MISADAPFVIFDEIDSTNEEARRRAMAGDFEPAWLLAKRQTAGRGRRGRSWTTVGGNMFLTYYGVAAATPAQIALLGFAAGVALAEACAAIVEPRLVRLKWPNDLLLDDAKAAGILLEAGAVDARRTWFALGVGLNLVGAPEDVGQATAALKDFAAAPPSAVAMAEEFARRAGAWGRRLETEGFAPLQRAWEARARGLGQRIVVEMGPSRVAGVMRGLSPSGELVISVDEGGERLISAGDVYFPDGASV